MKITLSRYAGFCDGVKRAFEIVEKIARDPKTKRPIFVLGSLVHNDDVVGRIEEWGAQKIDLAKLQKLKGEEIGTMVVTAHGLPPETYELFQKKKIQVVDTTCPRVVKVQRLAKIFRERGYQIVIIGEKGHKEVKGIFGWAGRAGRIIENEAALASLKLDPRKRIAIISQTTQSLDFVDLANRRLKQKYPHAEIIPTICLSTQDRQGEAKKLARQNDLMIIIGSPESANSSRLWEVSRRINRRSHFIERSSQLKKSWFKGVRKIGVTAGASTPDWIIKEVLDSLRQIGKKAEAA